MEHLSRWARRCAKSRARALRTDNRDFVIWFPFLLLPFIGSTRILMLQDVDDEIAIQIVQSGDKAFPSTPSCSGLSRASKHVSTRQACRTKSQLEYNLLQDANAARVGAWLDPRHKAEDDARRKDSFGGKLRATDAPVSDSCSSENKRPPQPQASSILISRQIASAKE